MIQENINTWALAWKTPCRPTTHTSHTRCKTTQVKTQTKNMEGKREREGDIPCHSILEVRWEKGKGRALQGEGKGREGKEDAECGVCGGCAGVW